MGRDCVAPAPRAVRPVEEDLVQHCEVREDILEEEVLSQFLKD